MACILKKNKNWLMALHVYQLVCFCLCGCFLTKISCNVKQKKSLHMTTLKNYMDLCL